MVSTTTVGPRSSCLPREHTQILPSCSEFTVLNFWWQLIKFKGSGKEEKAGIAGLKANMEELIKLLSELYNTPLPSHKDSLKKI